MPERDTSDALTRLAGATQARAGADLAWKIAIRDAHAEGCSLRAIATRAGVSYQRVQQILAGK